MAAKKVVITGRGLVTPIGFGVQENIDALKNGKSGIVFLPEWQEAGLESNVGGKVSYEYDCPLFDRKKLRFMPENAKMAVAAAYEAITEAGYTPETLPGSEMAIINGCAGSAYAEVCTQVHVFRETGNLRRVSAFAVPRTMPSSAVANMSLVLGITGDSFDVSCACTSGALAVITAARMIQSGEYDIILAGGSEELSWQQALGFNAMRAISRNHNEQPHLASCPFDKKRDGFVMAEGAGMLVLESEEHARKRGAVIHGEIKGFAVNSNATDMVAPDRDSSAAVMQKALKHAGLQPEDITYINTHGTSTPVGDPIEINAIRDVFEKNPVLAINSTKSQIGHMIGATGAVEIIYSNLMIQESFVSPTLNLTEPDDEFSWADIVSETRYNFPINYALSNSFGFGGTNACVIVGKYE